MISTQQWRAVIGCFCPHRGKTKSTRVIVIGSRPIRTGLRILLFMSLCIILSGDVETNPGPNYAAVMQELKDFRLANERLLKELKTDMTSLKNEVTNIRKDLDNVTDRIDQERKYVDTIYDDLKGELFTMVSRIHRLERKLENQEQYSRRDNLLFYGVKGDKEETWATSKEKIVNLLNEKVQDKVWSSEDFVRVHRLRTKQQGTQPIIVRFIRSHDKFTVLNNRTSLKSSGVGVSTDLSHAQREELHQLKLKGQKGYIKNGKVQIDNRHNYTADTSVQGSIDRSSGNADYRQRARFRFGDQRGYPQGGFPNSDNSQDSRNTVQGGSDGAGGNP